MEIPVLDELVTIFGLAIVVVLLCHRLRIAPIVGFLLTGVLAGPHGFGLVTAVHEVETLAEIGVIMLLFVIGLELSVAELTRLKKPVFVGGAAQVGLSVLLAGSLAWLLGLAPNRALFVGFLVSLSSTAIVLKLLQERAEIEAPHGRIALSVLIFQDIVAVPMMLLIPFLAGTGGAGGGLALLLIGGKAVAVVAAVFVLSRKIVPFILGRVVRTKSRELFLLSTLAICLAVGYLTSLAGLSIALGAFLAGLVIADSEYSLAALEGILPFRDVFTSVFFVSIGMLLDAGYFLAHLPLVAGLALAVMAGKCLLAGSAAGMLGYPLRIDVLTGLALCQVGEFSFILASAGLTAGLIGASGYQLFLAASILSMALTPFVIRGAPAIADRVCRLTGRGGRQPKDVGGAACADSPACKGLCDHLIIIGFGVGGRHLARAAKRAGIRYAVLEMNPDTVRREAEAGEPIVYGDATAQAVLEHLHVTEARVMVVAISDPSATRRITEAARKLAPSLHLVVRTRFLSELGPLLALGASEVVPEEFETSIEIFTRVLNSYLVPRGEIERFAAEIRAEGYDILRPRDETGQVLDALKRNLGDHEVAGLSLAAGAPLDGKSLLETALRKAHGLSVVAVVRDGEVLPNPDAGFRLAAGDVVYVFGSRECVAAGLTLFTAPATAS
jgi:CPA2 family monovalent cation:H+ antiporter-2